MLRVFLIHKEENNERGRNMEGTKHALAERIREIAPEVDWGVAVRIAKNLRDELGAQERVSTREELAELPVGSVVKAHWTDGSQPDYRVMRIEKDGGASTGQGSVAGGKWWTALAGWGAELTVLYRADGGES
jgi:hypothetical protein